MTLDPELVALTRRLRPFRRRLWLRRVVRDSVRIGAVVTVVLLGLAIVARIIPFEWLAAAAIGAVVIGLLAIAVDAVRVRPTLAEAALAIDTEEGLNDRVSTALALAKSSPELAEAAEAESAWNSSGVGSAEEAYGDYQLVVDAIADRLLDIRESYAHSLDEDAADEYRDTFTRTASRRYRRYATLLADLDLDED